MLVHSMDRLARNNRDLNLLVEKITGKAVAVRFVKEGIAIAKTKGVYKGRIKDRHKKAIEHP